MNYKVGLKLKCKEDINWTIMKFEKNKYYKIIQILPFGDYLSYFVENPNTYLSGDLFELIELQKYFYTDKELRKEKLKKLNS
jgi:hypothetical protein